MYKMVGSLVFNGIFNTKKGYIVRIHNAIYLKSAQKPMDIITKKLNHVSSSQTQKSRSNLMKT